MSTFDEIIEGANATVFGCVSCEHREGNMCWHDPKLPRLIATWGWCPKSGEDGPVQEWRGPCRKISKPDRSDCPTQNIKEREI